MGAFELGFSQGADRSASNLARSRQLQDEQRQQNLQRNWGILNDPKAADDVKHAAGDDIKNQYPTPEHKGTFLSDILHLHLGHKSAQPIPPPPANPISGAPDAPDQPAKDQLGVPYASAAPASTPPGAPAPTTPQQPIAAVKAAGSAPTPQAAMDLWKQYRGPVAVNEDIAQQHAQKAAEYAQNLEKQRAAAAIDLAKTRAQYGVGITPENRYLQQYAVQHGYGTAGEMNADEMADAMRGYKAANATPGWKSVTDGNDIYAVDSHNPNGQRKLIGHKDDLTQRQEFRTMTNPDGSTFLVPVTVWSKKGSSSPVMETQDGSAPVSASTPQGPGGASQPASGAPATAPTQSGAPVSSATPQGVPGASATPANPGARPAGASPSGGAKKQAPTRIPSSSVGAPIAFGGKINPLDKADISVYQGLDKEATQDANTANFYEQAYQQPGNKSAYDTSLVTDYTGILSKGGRKTQAEIAFAQRIGGLGLRLDAMLSKAQNGELPPEMRKLYVDYLKDRSKEETSNAQKMRGDIQQRLSPTSTKTPKAPGAWTAPKDAPAAPQQDGKVLKSNGQVVAVSKGGNWVQP